MICLVGVLLILISGLTKKKKTTATTTERTTFQVKIDWAFPLFFIFLLLFEVQQKEKKRIKMNFSSDFAKVNDLKTQEESERE